MKIGIETNTIKTTNNRELCPICGADVTIIKMHEPCTISWDSQGNYRYSKPVKVRNIINLDFPNNT